MMYYCEKCRVKNEWPDAFVRSSGKCECCGEGAVCWDRPSSSLPRVVRPVANNVAAQAGGEPMGICCYGGSPKPKSSCASCAAWQVSPRATADVEQLVLDLSKWTGEGGMTMANDFVGRAKAILATTKPGA